MTAPAVDMRALRMRAILADPDPWWSVRLGGLAQLVEQVKPRTVLEIGCCRGHSTEVFLLHAERVVALDPWPIEDELNEFIARCGWYPGLEMVRARSPEAVQPGWRFDLVYIDGDHSYEAVRADIRAGWPICRTLAGHDYNIPGVRRAVEEHRAAAGLLEPSVFPDTSWLIRRC